MKLHLIRYGLQLFLGGIFIDLLQWRLNLEASRYPEIPLSFPKLLKIESKLTTAQTDWGKIQEKYFITVGFLNAYQNFLRSGNVGEGDE